MENFVYNSINKYFNVLIKMGYVKDKTVEDLVVLIFYYHLLYDDFRGYITKEDYRSIEKALNCLYGTSCLIPYPDYLKMGKLHLGEMTELAQRVKNLEETEVLKAFDGENENSDIMIVSDDSEEPEQ